MLLELITGRRPVDTTQTYMDDSLVDWVIILNIFSCFDVFIMLPNFSPLALIIANDLSI
jgi:hypothetical protein